MNYELRDTIVDNPAMNYELRDTIEEIVSHLHSRLWTPGAVQEPVQKQGVSVPITPTLCPNIAPKICKKEPKDTNCTRASHNTTKVRELATCMHITNNQNTRLQRLRRPASSREGILRATTAIPLRD